MPQWLLCRKKVVGLYFCLFEDRVQRALQHVAGVIGKVVYRFVAGLNQIS
jgi:hypothetical protein